VRTLSGEEKAWLLIFLVSLCFLLFGQCRDGWAESSIESHYAFPYHRYNSRACGAEGASPWINQYRIERYRNLERYRSGFGDPVPRVTTSKPWAIDDWNYRIIRQHERWRRWEEHRQGIKIPERKNR